MFLTQENYRLNNWVLFQTVWCCAGNVGTNGTSDMNEWWVTFDEGTKLLKSVSFGGKIHVFG